MYSYEAEKAVYSDEISQKLENFILQEVSKDPQNIVDLVIGAKKLNLGTSPTGTMLPSPRYLTGLAEKLVSKGLLERRGTGGVYAQCGASQNVAAESPRKDLPLSVFKVLLESQGTYSGAPTQKKTALVVARSDRDVWDKYESGTEKYGCLTKVVKVRKIGEVDCVLTESLLNKTLAL